MISVCQLTAGCLILLPSYEILMAFTDTAFLSVSLSEPYEASQIRGGGAQHFKDIFSLKLQGHFLKTERVLLSSLQNLVGNVSLVLPSSYCYANLLEAMFLRIKHTAKTVDNTFVMNMKIWSVDWPSILMEGVEETLTSQQTEPR